MGHLGNIASALLFLCLVTITLTEPVVVETGIGRIIGRTDTVTINGGGVTVKKFLGIPYAKPPVGERRFSKPEPVERLVGDYEALEFGAACWQPPTDAFREFPKMSEDCLYLNVYVPEQRADIPEAGHAVMVFIHGGGFQHGAGETYPGDSLASTGNVIVVTLNYRLNLFGFLSSGDEVIPGNFGFWDQHMALQWVNNHIKAFGGDNSRVTVFGESAGGSGAVYQGLLPHNKGLVTRILAQSGAPSLRLTMNPMPKAQFYFLAQAFDCIKDSPLETISCMKHKDPVSMLMTLRSIGMELKQQQNPDINKAVALYFFPTLDGDFFKQSPADLYQQSKTEVPESIEFFRTLDLMIGHNSEEGSLMLYNSLFYPIPDVDSFRPSRDDLNGGLIDAVMVHDFGLAPVPDIIKSMYVSEFTDWSDPFNPETIRRTYVNLMGGVAFNRATIEFVRMHVNQTSGISSNSYAYVFDAIPSTRLMATPSWATGTNHADELGFVFGFMDKLLEDFRRKPSPPAAWEWELSKLIQIKWSNFAKTGNPNAPVEMGPMWPKYDMASQQCFTLTNDMANRDSASVPFCYGRKANFLLDLVPDVMASLINQHGASSLYKGGDFCDAADGECNKT